MKVNNFQTDLDFSHSAEDLPLWKEIYTKAFPGFLSMTSQREDGDPQRSGIDRTIVLSSNKAIYIDEKVRRVNYNDILLEYISNDTTNSIGWVEKPLWCDYIAYAIIPQRRCYLLPVPQLQKAWMKNKKEWLEKYGTKSAGNKSYNTLSCPVPINTLYLAIGNALRILF